jgi:heme-degrading monooxygenase HmoA
MIVTVRDTAMFIAMNRFRIALGREQEFLDMWRRRESYLDEVPGFREFHMLRGAPAEDHTPFISHSVWESYDAFDAWTHSEAFRKAHAQAGAAKGVYLGPPRFEGFDVVI